MVLKIALCDDSNAAIDKYANLLVSCAKKHHLELWLSSFASGEALLFQLSEKPDQFDIIYLDIYMHHMDGIETARKLRELSCNAQIVFLTSCPDYVYDAFDVHAVHYLLKDAVTVERFEEVFLRAVKLAEKKEKEQFAFEFQGKKRMVPLDRISHFEIWRRVVTVHHDGRMDKFYSSMERLEEQLANKDFVRVHRSFLVHLPYIAQLQTGNLLMRNGVSIPVGVTYASSLKRQFSGYISRSHIMLPTNL